MEDVLSMPSVKVVSKNGSLFKAFFYPQMGFSVVYSFLNMKVLLMGRNTVPSSRSLMRLRNLTVCIAHV